MVGQDFTKQKGYYYHVVKTLMTLPMIRDEFVKHILVKGVKL